MKTIIISGWEIGFKKVEHTKLLRSMLGLSLSQAKHATDEVLAGKRVTLQIPGDLRGEIVAQLTGLGVRVDAETGLEG